MLLLISVNEKRERYQARADLGYQTIEAYDCVEAEDPDAPVGIKKIYTWTLPEKIKGDTALAFYFVHQYVCVYLDDELVYSVLPASGWRIGKTFGCDWTIVPLFQEDAGKNIRIEMIPVYKATINRTTIFYMGSKLGIFLAQAKRDKWQIIMSTISIIIGIVFLGIACYYIIERKQKKICWRWGRFRY